MTCYNLAGACDCHSHVFGPFATYPLAEERTFDPPESGIESLESVWRSLGVQRAVLVQGSAHGSDHRGMLAAIARAPDRRRGVALAHSGMTAETIAALHAGGVRAIRFNWIPHLLIGDARSERQRLLEAEGLASRVAELGWHVELHIDLTGLALAEELLSSSVTLLVIDHLARLDVGSAECDGDTAKLLRALERKALWVKLSGADRLTRHVARLEAATYIVRQVLQAAPERCVWGLDWPHVNLERRRTDEELAEFLVHAAGNEATLRKVLVENPERLYGFTQETNGA